MSGVEYIPHHFKHNAANTPDIHLERIVAIRKQAFRSPIPPCWDILGERWFRIDSATRAEISKFENLVFDQNVLWFHVAMKNSISMHVIQALHQLVHVVLNKCFRQMVMSPSDSFINVHIHELENQIKSFRGRIVDDIKKLDDIRVIVQSS